MCHIVVAQICNRLAEYCNSCFFIERNRFSNRKYGIEGIRTKIDILRVRDIIFHVDFVIAF